MGGVAVNSPYNDEAVAAQAMLRQHIAVTSELYRMRLQEKADSIRAAVLSGETSDLRVLALADTLDRLAGNMD